MVITTPHEADALRLIFGEQEATDWNAENIDWNKIDSQLISQRILVTRPEINGKRLASLRLRNNYGINISRVYRACSCWLRPTSCCNSVTASRWWAKRRISSMWRRSSATP